jgi:hypothetical protein
MSFLNHRKSLSLCLIINVKDHMRNAISVAPRTMGSNPQACDTTFNCNTLPANASLPVPTTTRAAQPTFTPLPDNSNAAAPLTISNSVFSTIHILSLVAYVTLF